MLQENAAKSDIEFIPDEEPKQQNDFEEVTFTPDENQPNLMQADIKDDEGLFSKVMNWYSDAVTAQAQLENLQERQKGEMISGAVQGGVNALIGQPADIVGSSLKLAGDIGDMPIIKELGSEMSNKANALDEFLGKRWISKEDEKIDPRISQISKVMASGGMQILPMQASSKYLGGAMTYALYTVPDAGETYFGAREEGKSKSESALLGGAVGTGFYAIDRFVDGSKLMKGMQNTSGGLFDVLLNSGKEAGAESLQEAYKNLVTKIGYDDSRNLMEGVLESAIGGFAGGGVAQMSVSIGGVEYNPSARFNDARQTALNNGATEQDIGTAMSELYNIMDNNPELASNYLTGVIEKNAAGMTDLIRQMPTNVAYQSVDDFYKTADEFIKNNEGTPEAKEAQKIKTELDEAYKDTYNALENLMPKEQAEANAKLVQGHALFASREFGISPKQYMDNMFADVELSEYYVQEQPKVKRPVSLLRFLILNGGIKDDHGELKALDAHKGRPGLVNNKYGLSLDRAREMAEQAGYFGTKAQINYGTTSISDFLDLIDKELRGNKVFTEEDAIKQKEIDERLAEEEYRDQEEDYYEQFLDEQGVDYSNMSFEEKKDAFNKLKPEAEPLAQNDQIDDEDDYIPFQEAMELAEEMEAIDAHNDEYTGETINIDGIDKTVYNSNGDRIAKSEEALRSFYKWFGDSKVVDEQGRPQVIYHGTKRGDRVGSRFRKERATSGPMAFSTTNKEIAEGYAKSKQDTSLMDEIWGDYNKWFSIDVNGKNYTLDKVWSALDYETMKRVRERAPHITVDYDSNEIPVIYDENVKNGNGGYRPGSQYNNAIRDLVDAWLTSGSLYGREERFIDILETAGIPRDKINYVDPNADYSKVYEMYASIQNPLDTENIDKKVVNKLKQNAKKQEKLKDAYGVDAWDKQTMDPDFWIEQLDYDLKTGSTNVWTSIPDWVTETLKGFGYDGIKDKGGKHGGQIHTVWIPFEENQYKATTNRGTFSADNPDIYYQEDTKHTQRLSQEKKGTPRGAYYNGIIHLFQNADASTFVHESMHFYREELKRLKDKSARAKSILNTLDSFAETEFEKNYKIKTTDIGYAVADKNGRTIYNNQGRLFATSEDAKEYAKEEIIARGFEQYVREGKSPSKYLARAFHSFMNWLKHLYKTAKSLGVELNDDVRQAYGDLLGGQDLDYWMGQSAENIMAETKAVEQDRKAYLDDIIADAVANKGTTVSQGKGKGAKDIWTKAMIPLSTRAKRISPKLRNRFRMFEFNLANELNKKYDKSRPFLDIWKKMSEDDAIAFDLALKNDYVEKQQEIIAKYGAEKEWSAIKGLLADIYSDAMNVGLDLGYREDYFPRKVKDVEGFMAYMQGLEDWTRYQQALKEADPENVFTMEEKAEFLNKYLRGFVRVDLMPVKYGSEKTRKIPVVDNDINKFYAESMESYISYIEGMNARIESAKFLGKDASNYEESIGGYLEYLQNNGLVDPSQIDDVREILQARFGQRGVGNRFLAAARDLSYIYTMGGINSAITQIEDFSVSMYKAGVWNTLSTIFGDKPITKKDLGIENISQEFVDGSKTSQWLNKMFKATGLDAIDSLGKETLVNAMLKKYKQIYAKDPQALRDYIEPIMEDQTNATINDILNGEKSDNVKFLLFSELSDVQPVSLSELPEFYNKSGNMRVLYMLKSFMVKRIDTFRNEAFDKIRSKDRDTRIQGMKNLLSMSILMMLCGATKDWIIDLLYGRKTDLPELMVNNLLGLFGITKFHLYKAREQGFTGVAKEFVVPPLFSFFDDLIGDVFKVSSGKRNVKDMEILKGIPLVGRFYYWWIGGGAEKQKKKKRGVVRK